ncbi:MAG: hypothetical protein M3198_06895 [Actinomycetota bacterium]|nr:hypothetical protein [Actinomycetota bacterium]
MRKAITTVLAAGLVFGALLAPAAEAGKLKKRKASATYTGPSAAVEGNGFCDPGCVTFPTKPSEKFAKFSVADATGLPVSVTVSQPDQDGDGFVDVVGAFCGKSGKIAISGGEPVKLFLYGHPTAGVFEQFGGPTACNGTATTGTVKALFTNK